LEAQKGVEPSLVEDPFIKACIRGHLEPFEHEGPGKLLFIPLFEIALHHLSEYEHHQILIRFLEHQFEGDEEVPHHSHEVNHRT
jgi:hypothetical protein